MCYFYSIVPQNFDQLVNDGIVQEMHLQKLENIFFASGFDAPLMPVITKLGSLEFLNWGLIPSWVKNLDNANDLRYKTLNAKDETVFEKPSFREAINKRRCLVICSGFYEWHTKGKNKYPFYIQLTNKNMFCFAGIWEQWTNPKNGELIKTYSVLTTEANDLMEKVHNTKRRMPVILTNEDAKLYMQSNLPTDKIQSLLKSIDAEDMEAYTIKRFSPSSIMGESHSDIQTYYPYPELAELLKDSDTTGWRTLFD